MIFFSPLAYVHTHTQKDALEIFSWKGKKKKALYIKKKKKKLLPPPPRLPGGLSRAHNTCD